MPAFAFAAIVALSLCAIPGLVPFLDGQVTLGTALLYATSYGAGVAIAALFIALIAVLRE